jgi:hypothetical protein
LLVLCANVIQHVGQLPIKTGESGLFVVQREVVIDGLPGF